MPEEAPGRKKDIPKSEKTRKRYAGQSAWEEERHTKEHENKEKVCRKKRLGGRKTYPRARKQEKGMPEEAPGRKKDIPKREKARKRSA